jgi:hyperosmotically inducible protein
MQETLAAAPYSFSIDDELQEAVTAAIGRDSVVRESRVPVEVSVEDGVVVVSGIASSETMRRRVLYAAATTPGVVRVIDRLTTDAEIEAAVAQALASDPAIRDATIAVSSYLGVVTLYGAPGSEERKARALELARAVPGVRQVDDMLVIEPA